MIRFFLFFYSSLILREGSMMDDSRREFILRLAIRIIVEIILSKLL